MLTQMRNISARVDQPGSSMVCDHDARDRIVTLSAEIEKLRTELLEMNYWKDWAEEQMDLLREKLAAAQSSTRRARHHVKSEYVHTYIKRFDALRPL